MRTRKWATSWSNRTVKTMDRWDWQLSTWQFQTFWSTSWVINRIYSRLTSALRLTSVSSILISIRTFWLYMDRPRRILMPMYRSFLAVSSVRKTRKIHGTTKLREGFIIRKVLLATWKSVKTLQILIRESLFVLTSLKNIRQTAPESSQT